MLLPVVKIFATTQAYNNKKSFKAYYKEYINNTHTRKIIRVNQENNTIGKKEAKKLFVIDQKFFR